MPSAGPGATNSSQLFASTTMSNLEATLAGGRPLFASKTTFEALAVDAGEESEEEEPQSTAERQIFFFLSILKHSTNFVIAHHLPRLNPRNLP